MVRDAISRSRRFETLRVKTLVQEIDRRTATGAEALLSLSRGRGIVVRSSITDRQHGAASLSNYKLCRPGELVMNRMQAWSGLIALSGHTGLISPDYAILVPRKGYNPRFLELRLTAPDMIAQYVEASKGIGSGFNRLYFQSLGRLHTSVPSFEDQGLIVRYLDHAELRIAKAIAAKQRMIALLDEKRRTELEGCLIRGLSRDVKLRDSGISEVEMIPAHWETPLAQMVFRERSRTPDPILDGPLSLSQRDGLVRAEDLRERSFKTSTYAAWKQVQAGDLVLNRFKAHLGVFFAATLGGMVSFHYGVFELRRQANVKYFELLFHTAAFRTVFAGRSNGMTVGLQNLSNQNFYGARIVVPPMAEQNEIVSHVDEQTRGLREAMTTIDEEIELLKEYRTRLISDVVTGKLDVREQATRLPEIDPMELAVVSSTGAVNDDDEESSDVD
jgi:type I restriction enzyme S subunit